jgi:chromosome segregation ATPase
MENAISQWIKNGKDLRKGCDLLLQLNPRMYRLVKIIIQRNDLASLEYELSKFAQTKALQSFNKYVSKIASQANKVSKEAVISGQQANKLRMIQKLSNQKAVLHTKLAEIKGNTPKEKTERSKIMAEMDLISENLDVLTGKKEAPKEEVPLEEQPKDELVREQARLRSKISKKKTKIKKTTDEAEKAKVEAELQELQDSLSKVTLLLAN